MKKVLKILAYILIGIFLLLGIAYLYLTDFGRTDLLSNEPREPRYEIPITYNVGWWSYQDQMKIESFGVKMIENNLNLFNSKSLMSYEIKGEINYSGHWKPYIHEVHISERITTDSTSHHHRIIEITPIVKTKKDKEKKGGIVKFDFKNEHTITSGGWGNNKIKIKCLDKEETIEFKQIK